MTEKYDSYLVRQCAPTLAGIKVGCLFCLESGCGCLVCKVVARWNRMLNGKGVYARVIAEKNGRSFVYIYRRAALSRLVLCDDVRNFLNKFGYSSFDEESLLASLHNRISQSVCFPHEVGIFLGYPLDDVKDFIAYGGRNYKLIGCWKVYHDVPNSMHIFEVYKKCNRDLWNRFEQGATLERLTVAS